jgi:lanosterol synthase
MSSAGAAVRSAIQRSLAHLAELQTQRGEWEAEVVWSPILLAQYLIVRNIVGKPAPRELHGEYLRYFDTWQTSEGGWGLHRESPAYLFVTTLVYVAMRMCGVSAGDERLVRACALIRTLGSPLALPTWGKLWLAFCNLYGYAGVYPVLPEMWLLPRFFPVHPSRWYCHTRLIYLGLCFLYGTRFQRPCDPLCRALRGELYERAYDAIDFRAARNRIAERDLFEPPSALLRLGYAIAGMAGKCIPARLHKRAMAAVLGRIEYEQRSTAYASISPVSGLLNVLALYAADPGHPGLGPSLDGVEYWQWRDTTEGVRYNGARSQTWDTAFTVQAAVAAGAGGAFTPALTRAASYLQTNQLTTELDNGAAFDRDPRLGGFCFSDAHHGWPVSDTTAEALCAVFALRDLGIPSLGDESIEAAVRFVLSRRNPDGGWGSYERSRGSLLLEHVNPSEMFGNCMVEHSYVECTASALDALGRFLRAFPGHILIKTIIAAMAAGERFIRRVQQSDGAWAGFWGINYTYGTFFAVRGLAACKRDANDKAVRRACDWIVGHQKTDGGWGEHWTSMVQRRYVEHPHSQVIMTAWALCALLLANDPRKDAIERGIGLLLAQQLQTGGWPKQGVAGVFFNTAMHHYELYREYFPLWALGLYGKRGAEG